MTIVVGLAPGGASGVSARLLASKLTQAFGKPFIVENRPGAISNIGSQQVARAQPDGYTLLLATIANVTNRLASKNNGYDTQRDLSPIVLFMSSPSRARFVPADVVPAAELPDADQPLVLIPGRQLEPWHTGSMTRRTGVLDAIEPDAVAMLHPLDLAAAGTEPGERVELATRRGRVELWGRADPVSPRGSVFVAFCWAEAAINQLTNAALDPVAKIPEFKFCAVRLARAAVSAEAAATA